MNETEQLTHPSAAKVTANRVNSLKSTGPRNTSVTRHNAIKHGLLAKGITALDVPSVYRDLLTRLETELKPVGAVERFLVESIALAMLRINRARQMEAEYITDVLNPMITKTIPSEMDMMFSSITQQVEIVDPGFRARVSADDAGTLTDSFQRYETALENKLYRALRELRQFQADNPRQLPSVSTPV